MTAGPSSNNGSSGAKYQLSDNEKQLYDTFRDFDIKAFDWDAFAGTYKGRALITRLTHLSTLLRMPPPPAGPEQDADAFLQEAPAYPPPPSLLSAMRESLRRSIETIKTQSLDKEAYSRALVQLDLLEGFEAGNTFQNESAIGLNGPNVDAEWVERVEEEGRREAGKLDVELKGYMSNLIKESIRLTYLALAQLSFKMGSPQGALKNYSYAREHSSSAQHHLDLGLGILDTCLAYNTPQNLPGHLTKLQAALDRVYPPDEKEKAKAAIGGKPVDVSIMTAAQVREKQEREVHDSALRMSVGVKISVARGIIALVERRYEEAGRLMGRVTEDGGLGEWEGAVISTSDVCLIATLCVLATGDREKIRENLLNRMSFRTSLDDSQGWILDMIRAFMSANYGEVDAIFKTIRPLLALNPFLSGHAQLLGRLIKTRSIVQYVEPFSSVKIGTMASVFGVAEKEMLYTVDELISDGFIKGRIDFVDKILVVKAPNPRTTLIADSLRAGQEITSSSVAALLRMRLHEANIIVNPRSNAKQDEDGFSLEENPLAATATTTVK